MMVLWLVRDGTGFLLARNLTMTMMRRARTNKVIGTMNHSVYSSNHRTWRMIGVAAGCIPICHGIG